MESYTHRWISPAIHYSYLLTCESVWSVYSAKNVCKKIILPMIRQKRIETIRRLRHKYTRIDASHQLDDYFYWRSGFNFISQKCIEDQRTKNSSIPIFIDNELQYLSVEENEMFYNYLVFVKYNDVVNQCPMTIINRS